MFPNHPFDVHGHARSERQQTMAHDEIISDEVGCRGEIERNAGGLNIDLQVGAARSQSQHEESSVASSLFSHSENELASSSVNEIINVDSNLETTPPANPERYESSDVGSLFSRSSGSPEPITPAKMKAHAPSTVEPVSSSSKNDVEMNIPPMLAGVDGCRDDSSSCSLFSQSDTELSNHETMICNNKHMIVSESTDAPSQDNQETWDRPVYETFERPTYKPDDESDSESSDEGSLFSLEEHEYETPTSRHLQNFHIPRKKAFSTSFGSPTIPRKKSASRPVESSAPPNKTPNRPFLKLARQSPRERALNHDHKVKEKVKSTSTVSFVEVGGKPKCVGRSARAMKVSLPQDELMCSEIGDSSSKKGESRETNMYSWQQSSKEKLWNREFSKLRQFMKGHGHCDVPDGHTLSGWIRRQQRVCQRWLHHYYDPREEISDNELQMFVHIFRLHKVGFVWGHRIQHRVSSAILNWSNMLDPCKQTLLLKYGVKVSPSVTKFAAKAAVDHDAYSSDEEYELDVSMFDTQRRKTKGKKRGRDQDHHDDTNKNRSRLKTEQIRPFRIVPRDNFRDERPQMLSWNSSAHTQSTREKRLQLSRIVWNRALELHTKNLGTNNIASIASSQKCWFDVHNVLSASTITNAHIESPLDKGLSGSSENEVKRQDICVTMSDPGGQGKCPGMHEDRPFDTALQLRSNSRKESSRVAVSTDVSVIDLTISVEAPGVSGHNERRWFDLEISESRPTNSLNKFPTMRSTESEKQTYITNLERAVRRGNSRSFHAVAPHEPRDVVATVATLTNAEQKTISIESCPCDITMDDNQSHTLASDVESNAHTDAEMRPVPVGEKAHTKVKEMVGPKVLNIPTEPSEEFVGWSVRRMPRKDGGSYCYFYSPQLGARFRSKKDVRRFIKILKEKGNEASAIDEYGRSSTQKKSPMKTKTRTIDEAPKNSSDSCTPQKHAGSILGEGDEVYAAWESTKKRKVPPIFYLGVVKSVRLSEGGNAHRRVYDIRYANGNELNDVDESLVIPKYEYIHRNLKPIYMIGEKVYSAWWPVTKNRKSSPSWYPGIVKGRRELPRGGRYGPSIVYDILFDDGDEHDNVDDHFVFLRNEYLLATRQFAENKSEWIGVRNVVDKSSSDHWAKIVGWYVASIDGKDQPFSLLSDALKAYDSHTVKKLGVNTKETDLNLPEEWIFSTSIRGPVRREGSAQSPLCKKRHSHEVYVHSDSSVGTPLSGDSIIRRHTSSLTVKQPCHVLKWNSVKLNTKNNVSENGHPVQMRIESRVCETDPDRSESNEWNGTDLSKKKPAYKKGEKIYALWSGGTQKWYPGRIWDIKFSSSSSDYGAVRTFDVIYDDGDTETDLKEIFVMKKADYELCMMKEEKDWIGVKNVTDPNSRDDFARAVGWYEVNIEGTNHVFSSLGDALRFYDVNLVKRRGCRSHVLDSELNFPDEH